MIEEGKGPFAERLELPQDLGRGIVGPASPIPFRIPADPVRDDLGRSFEKDDRLDRDVSFEGPRLPEMPGESVQDDEVPAPPLIRGREAAEDLHGDGEFGILEKSPRGQGAPDDLEVIPCESRRGPGRCRFPQSRAEIEVAASPSAQALALQEIPERGFPRACRAGKKDRRDPHQFLL